MGNSTSYILIISIAAIMLSALILPSKNEVAVMHYRNGDIEDSITYYEKEFKENKESSFVINPLIQSYINAGQIEKAVKFVEQNNLSKRKDIIALGEDLYDEMATPVAYKKWLYSRYEATKDIEFLRKLLYLHIKNGNNNEYLNTLDKLFNDYPKAITTQNATKLAIFFAHNKQIDKLIKIVEIVEKREDSADSFNFIVASVKILITANRSKKAFEVAEKSLSQNDAPDRAIQLSYAFQQMHHYMDAKKLLTPYTKKYLNKNLSFTAQYISALINNRDSNEIHKYARNLNKLEISVDSDIFLSIAPILLENADFTLFNKLIKKTDVQSLNIPDLIYYINVAKQAKQTRTILNIRQLLGAQYLHKNKYVSAIINHTLGNKVSLKTLDYLSRNRSNNFAKNSALAKIYFTHGKYQKAFNLIKNVSATNIKNGFDIQWFSQLCAKSKNINKCANILRKIQKNPYLLSNKDKKEIAYIKALLAIYAKNGKYAIKYINNNLLTQEQIKNLYYVAEDVAESVAENTEANIAEKENDTANKIAKILIRRYPNADNRIIFAEYLNREKLFVKTLKILNPVSIKSDSKKVYLYLQAVSGLVLQDEVEEHHTQKAKTLLDHIISTDSKKYPTDIKMHIAYLFLHTELKDSSYKIFFNIANKNNTEYAFEALSELLDYWETQEVNPENTDWLKKKVKSPDKKIRIAVLKHLNDTKDYSSVINALEKDSSLDTENQTEYAKALLHSDVPKYLEYIKKNNRYEELTDSEKNYVRISFYDSVDTMSIPAIKETLKIFPKDNNILQKLAAKLFYEGRYKEAKSIFINDLDATNKNYKSNYILGEIFASEKKSQQAKKYYNIALKQLSSIKKENNESRSIKAFLLYKTGKVESSLQEFDKILENDPKNFKARSDYGNILMEIGKYSKAREILE